MKRIAHLLLAATFIPAALFAQGKAPEKPKDKGVFVEPKSPFWDEIQKSLDESGRAKPAPPHGVRRRSRGIRRAQGARGVQGAADFMVHKDAVKGVIDVK